MKITKQDEKRFAEIEDSAVNWFLDKMDFDITDWIAVEDLPFWREYRKEEDGSCPCCGEENESCECK